MLQLGGVWLPGCFVILCDMTSFIFAALSMNKYRRHADREHKSPTSPIVSAVHKIAHAHIQGSLL